MCEIELTDNEMRGIAVRISSRVAHPTALSPTKAIPDPSKMEPTRPVQFLPQAIRIEWKQHA
jgi:hypothetical protein